MSIASVSQSQWEKSDTAVTMFKEAGEVYFDPENI